jgi:DNA mismatch repair protein MutL
MSPRIKILPENLTNKIAAGEVVERPASVVKELVENSLDAGCSEVVVEIESGGRRLIQVSDDGCGMSREDALLCLERHATSKITTDEDLFSLSTLGFRGEALPSIASVSRFTLQSRERGSIRGNEIYAEGGRIREVKACGMAEGTSVSVRNLFFNTPARLKFMKSSETEAGHIGDLMTRLAISRPDVRFAYFNDGKTVFRAAGSDLRERIATLLGRSLAAGLFPFRLDAECAGITGFAARPDCSRSSASHLYTYINGRFIRDRVVQHAILQSYRSLLERGRFPVVMLFLVVPAGDVDINVHPTKHEVRFREQGRVHDAIVAAIGNILRETPWARSAPAVVSTRPTEQKLSVSERRVEEVREMPEQYRPAAPRQKTFTSEDIGLDQVSTTESSAGPEKVEIRQNYFMSVAVIGQYKAQYIICQDGTDLVIIDQHAAHERIAFEKLKKEFTADGVESQNLLFPETMDLSFKEAASVRENEHEIRQLGFWIENFGGSTWVVNSVPRLLEKGDYLRVLRDIIDELQELGKSSCFDQVREAMLARIACHSVIRGGQQLTSQEIRSLFVQLDASDFSGNCPHGRPVFRKITISEIEKMFRRA